MFEGLRVRHAGSSLRGPRFLMLAVSLTCTAVILPAAIAGAGSGWTVAKTPNADTQNNTLLAISCPSKTTCIAVGFYDDASTLQNRTLAERWNGSKWTLMSSPNPGAFADRLTGISCKSATSCMAVGYQLTSNTSPDRSLAMSWNGTAWKALATPNVGSNNRLAGVSCARTNACMAVGIHSLSLPPTGNATLAMIWNGSKWKLSSSPNGPGTNDWFNAVSCVAKPSLVCFAVGGDASGRTTPVAARWLNNSWKLLTIIGTGNDANLFGIACTSLKNCSAVGEYLNGKFVSQTLVEGWNGSKWIALPSQNAGIGTNNQLQSVWCVSATSCTSSGWSETGGGSSSSLIVALAGGAWKIESSPSPGGQAILYGTACVTSTKCWVVGGSFSTTTNSEQTLIEAHS
jgi:hypothetical protein